MADIPELIAPMDSTDSSSQSGMLEESMQQTKSRGHEDFLSTMQAVSKVNPDQFAKATQLEKVSGIPADVLNKQSEKMERLLQGNRFNAIFSSYNRTAHALRNGRLAAIAQDDLDNLTRIEGAEQVARFNEQGTGEKLLGALKQSFLGSRQGGKLSYADALERKQRQFDRIDVELARAVEAGEEPFASSTRPSGFGFDYLQADAERRTEMRQSLRAAQESALSWVSADQATIEAMPVEPGVIRRQELEHEGDGSFSATLESIGEHPAYAARSAAGAIVSSAEMLAAGIVGGIPLAAAAGFTAESNAKLSDVLREANIDLSDPKAVLAALQDDELMSNARARAARKAAGTTAVDVLTMGLAGRLLVPKSIGGKPLSGTQRELANLAVQAPVQGVTEGVGEAAGQYLADQKINAGDVLMEAIAGAGMSSANVAVFGGRRLFDNMAEGMAKSRLARRDKATLDEMVGAAGESKARARSPDSFRNIVDEQLKDTSQEMISIPAEALSKLFQSGAPLGETLAKIPGLTEQFAEAQARNGSVSLKTADYLAHFPLEYHEQLSSSIRTQVDGMSIEESEAWQAEQEQQIVDLAQQWGRDPDEHDEALISMMGELRQAGFSRNDAEQYAATHISTMSTLAERTGKPLAELMARFGLDIRNKPPENIQLIPVDDLLLAVRRLRTGDVPRSADMFGKSLVEYLRDLGGLDDSGGELAALDADVGRVGRNRLTRKEGGRSLDDAAMNAWERGYFPGVAREDVTPQLIVDAIRDDMAGTPRYSVEQENATLRDQAVNLEQLREHLDRLGVDLAEMSDEDVLTMLRAPDAPAGQTLEQGADGNDARGSISFGEGPGRRFQISLSEKRDPSTLLHELGHYYLEVMNDLAQDADAPQQIIDDVAAIRKWTGAKDTGPFETEQHEQFARGFELYLSEGKAPNVEIQGAFSRFKRWIIAVYKDLSRLRVELSPEVRAIMDRLVATDQQILVAEQAVQAIPLFESAAKAGWSEAEHAAYLETVELAHAEATTEIEQRIIREEERRRSKWWAEESDRVRQEVSEELDEVREYAAIKALRNGEMPDGTPTTMKLSSAEIKERYGVGVLKKLFLMHAKKDGMPMDLLAPMLGYNSGDEMIKAILSTPSRSEALNHETMLRMEERHGAKSTGEATEAAMAAVHNEKRGAVLIKELHALGKRGNRKNITSQQVMKQAAERIMQQRKVRDIQPYEYQRAEAKAGRAAFDAAAKGDLDAAFVAKQQQLLNFFLWREALKARQAADIIVTRMDTYNRRSKREKLGKAGHDYLDQIDAIMEQYEFRNVSLRELDKRVSFTQWYSDQVAAGNDPYVPEFVLNTSQRVNYKDLTLEQLTELDEFVESINHLAGLKNKLQANKRVKDRKEAQNLLSASAFRNMGKLPIAHIDANSRSLPDIAKEWASKGNSSLMKMEQIVDWLDGGDPNGAWSTIFYQPLAEAQHQRDDWNKAITMKVVELTNAWMNERGSKVGELFQIPGVATPISTNGMLAVALNTGNLGNRSKLLKGYNWEEATLDAILARMTEADWRFVERMWQTVESLWPAIVDLEKKVNGVAPPKVEGIKIQTRWGEIQGGYWPLVYDTLSSQYADVQKSLGALAPLGETGTVRATPARGHTEARIESFAAPIVLDVGVIGYHLGQVIHDLTHRIPLADAHSLIRGEVREAMNQTIGPSMAAQFKNILDGIASDQATGSDKSVGAFVKVMNTLRVNQAIAWMGYSVTTVLNQLGGFSSALDYFAQQGGRKYMYRGMIKYFGSPLKTMKMIREMSGEMRNRAINLDASIREAQQLVTRMKDGRVVQDAFKGMQNGLDVMVKYAFVPMQVAQSVVDSVVWSGAYEMAGGSLNHEEAVVAGDRAVRLTQTAGGAKDMATIQQNILAKMFMPVYGYASLLWNRNVDIARSGVQGVKNRSAMEVLVAFERFVYLNIIPAILTGMIKGALPGDEDDDETWAGWITTQSLLGVSAGIPLIGPATQGIFSEFGYGGASTIGQGLDSLMRASSANKDQTIATNAISAIGAFTGLPSSQINRSVKTYFMLENREMDDSAGAVMRGILLGPKKLE